jgi:hypothetical protein
MKLSRAGTGLLLIFYVTQMQRYVRPVVKKMEESWTSPGQRLTAGDDDYYKIFRLIERHTVRYASE